jgi:diaminohydroxyphosphoribosylaminopyrimidine deaminase/5-amino-6-(5-phosphoribosylamino)uracil reductase
MQDPFPEVSGNGIVALGKAGIDVRVGLMRHQAAALNEGFISRVTRERPFVRMKVASSIDGATAMANGQSQWITGTEARQDVQKLRASSGAVLTGVGTVLEDDPSLTVRDKSLTDVQPLRIVLDTNLRMPPASCMLTLPGTTAIFCGDDANRAALEAAGATIYVTDTDNGESGRVDPAAVLRRLAALEINDLLFLTAGLVDELVIYQAPHIMGSQTRGMFSTPGWENLSDRVELNLIDMRTVGNDCRIIARPVSSIA